MSPFDFAETGGIPLGGDLPQYRGVERPVGRLPSPARGPEPQLARLVGSTPLQVEMTLLKTSSYTPTNTSAEHMLAFYKPWQEVAEEKFDGLIVTGAPVEEMDFEDVDYWPELTEILDWSKSNVFHTFNICWG
ncbi:MAG: hypothetical protein HON70_03015, partial [Lentisphaerae bacterium]|nr:hypothetical protein [Lentisphaerota bacterium]